MLSEINKLAQSKNFQKIIKNIELLQNSCAWREIAVVLNKTSQFQKPLFDVEDISRLLKQLENKQIKAISKINLPIE